MGKTSSDILSEGQRVVSLSEAREIPLRLLGGVAIRLRCSEATQRPELERECKDIDVAAPKKASRKVREFLEDQGYVPDRAFNALQGASRLLFFDMEHNRQLDVFVGTFNMCHELDLERRLAFGGASLPPSDLLLLKLQIVELNMKDITDALALFLECEPVEEDDADTLSTTYISELCAIDWGWFTTLSDNLLMVREYARSVLQVQRDVSVVQSRIDTLLETMRYAPKSLRWRMRNKIGRRVTWYELPEEVDQ